MSDPYANVYWVSSSWMWAFPVTWFIICGILGHYMVDPSYGPADSYFAMLPVGIIAFMIAAALAFAVLGGLRLLGLDIGFQG